MQDIQNRENIHCIISSLYEKLLIDDVLKHFFEDIISNKSLEEHLNIVTDFWNGILFNSTNYQRNAMQPHLVLNQTKRFKKEHFIRWLLHFNTSVDDNFIGEKAEMAKTRALSIATIMEIKVVSSQNQN